MKIIMLMGSLNRNGSTGILVENFKKGAEEAGHTVEVIDGCGTPGMTKRSRYPQEAYLLGRSL